MSRHLPALKPRDVLRALKHAGFSVHHISGSHYILKPEDRVDLRVTLPWHGKRFEAQDAEVDHRSVWVDRRRVPWPLVMDE